MGFPTSSPFQTRTVVLEQGELKNNRKNQVFKVNSAEIINMTDNKISTLDTDDVVEDEVNVKERATIFGPRKVAECKDGVSLSSSRSGSDQKAEEVLRGQRHPPHITEQDQKHGGSL